MLVAPDWAQLLANVNGRAQLHPLHAGQVSAFCSNLIELLWVLAQLCLEHESSLRRNQVRQSGLLLFMRAVASSCSLAACRW